MAGGTPSKAKTDASESVVGLLKPESAKATTTVPQLSVADGVSEQNIDLDKEDMERDLQETTDDGLFAFCCVTPNP